MHRLTKATQIPKEVKEKVYERDNHRCLMCGRYVHVSNACCHYISRAHSGLGIEQNILTLCADCHRKYDNPEDIIFKEEWKLKFGQYLSSKYENWNEEDLVYKKWRY